MHSLLFVLALLAARTLSWPSLDVTAKLDAESQLHITERHRMLFNGDWNGGERKFRIEPGQRLELVSVSRVGASGDPVPLTRAFGNPAIDQYVWDGSTLRWRARQPDDEPFRNRELTYIIEYKLRNAVAREGDIYSLEHDFAFADRAGAIANYTLNFDIDPAWTPAPGFEPKIVRTGLLPGQSVILDTPLQWNREGEPPNLAVPVNRALQSVAPRAPAKPPPPPRLPRVISVPAFVVFVLAATAMLLRFRRREESVGRFEPDPAVTPEWLETNLLPHRAEVVGASWDRQTGQAEVAALIAIMTTEGKIENIPGTKPRLRLLVPRDTLTEYERVFVDKLFVSGDEIDPETLRKHYKATGFDPSTPIKHSLHTASRNLVGEGAGCAGLVMAAIGFIISFAFFPIVAAMTGERFTFSFTGTILFVTTFVLVIAYNSKNGSRRLLPYLMMPLVVSAAIIASLSTSLAGLMIFLALTLLLLWFALRSAGWHGSAEESRRMRDFRAAREWFSRVLTEGAAEIDERWIPYMLAFGLGDKLDQWFVAAPVSVNAPRRRIYNARTGSTAISPGSSPGAGLAPAGGAFGGAGATGGWAQSIGSFAAAVPPPAPPRSSSGSSRSSWSSGSSSSSSRSSGGSRSGGGGGGGW